jgi:hypothetical protein
MKRITAILVALIYILPSIGYSIDTHWCRGRMVTFSISAFRPAKCATCPVPKKCCKNIHTVVKLKDMQHASGGIKVISGASTFNACGIYPLRQPNYAVSMPAHYIQCKSPPKKDKQPVYLTNSIIRV